MSRITLPWKVSGFLSLQMLHIKHKGITFQVSRLFHLLKCPFQHPRIYHWYLHNPAHTKQKEHKSPQFLSNYTMYKNRWPSNSWFDLHMQHLFDCCQIFPNAVVQVKKAILGGALTLHMLLQGEEQSPSNLKALK